LFPWLNDILCCGISFETKGVINAIMSNIQIDQRIIATGVGRIRADRGFRNTGTGVMVKVKGAAKEQWKNMVPYPTT